MMIRSLFKTLALGCMVALAMGVLEGFQAPAGAAERMVPSYSPDGRRILFSSKADLFVMNADGTGVTRLTQTPDAEYSGSWSPDGQRIAYSATLAPPGGDVTQGVSASAPTAVYVMNADGTNKKQVSTDPTMSHPAWSPDGRTLTVAARENDVINIFTIRPDGTARTQVTKLPQESWNSGPVWSASGGIAFASMRPGPGGTQEGAIWVIKPDGTGLHKVTDGTVMASSPAWSPDGTMLAFHGRRSDRNTDIYVVNADGSNLRRLTEDPKTDEFPKWSPDGKRLLFQSTRSGAPDIYTMNVDGSGVRPIPR